MTDFIKYIIDLNIVFSILYISYKLLFRKDRNFVLRRYFLIAIMVLSIILPLTPSLSLRGFSGTIPTFSLSEITVFGENGIGDSPKQISLIFVFTLIYFTVLISGFIRLITHFIRILVATRRSERRELNGEIVHSNRLLHASSFFNYIFIDLYNNREESIYHILEHEVVHKNEMHSVDRILTEIVLLICWFNPFVWLYKKSVIENHEYLADSTVISSGTNIIKYQISILNQYIERPSITNQFSSHIKKRIKMLNTTYKSGSKWKIAMLLPIAIFAFFLISCTDKKEEITADDLVENSLLPTPEIFYIVEEMPTFNGKNASVEFRKYIAQNVKYPKEAAENGVGGKIIIKFMVTAEGKVVIPDIEILAKAEGKSLDEVVVVTYRPIGEDSGEPDEKYIELLKEEAIRVVSASPAWQPGKQRGKSVNVLYTFPINFVLQ